MNENQTGAKKIKASALAEICPEKFLTALCEGAQSFGIELGEKEKSQLTAYYEQLVNTNRVMNLTGITEAVEVAQKHVIDSLVLLGQVLPYRSLIDVGSGAGLPGVPLAVLQPDAETVLLDSQRKRCDFLREVGQNLGLERLAVLWLRAEAAGQSPEYRQHFDLAVARAVAPLEQLLEYLLPLVRVGGEVCALKGAKAAEEIKTAQNAAKILGAEFLPRFEYEISGEKHCLVRLKKIKPTPAKYPRNGGLIKKNPL